MFQLLALLKLLVTPLIFIFVTLFGVGYVLPRCWVSFERTIWKIRFGGSVASEWIIDYAIKDFQLSIIEIEMDEGAQRTLAILLAIWRRLKSFAALYAELARMQQGRVEAMFDSAIDKLNEGWRSGTPARLLDRYINTIEALAAHASISKRDRIRGLSSVALVKYALGDLVGGNKLGKKQWRMADRLPPEEKRIAKWMSFYSFCNSTLFLGGFDAAMDMMARQWSNHYGKLDRREKRLLRNALADLITLNPILAVPRHIILAAAFSDGAAPKLKERDYWPSAAAYESQNLSNNDLLLELNFIESWYQEALTICADDVISLNFSLAYSAFAFSLLLLEPRLEDAVREELHEKIKAAFRAIEEPAPIVSQYVLHGFRGIYLLILERNHEALDSFRLAAVSSSISGNSFASCLFMCCHAVAAQRLSPYVETEVNYYLKEAKKLADSIGGDFYPRLWAHTMAAVSMLRGEHGRAERYLLKSTRGRKGKRIMRIFQPDLQPPSRPHPGGELLVRW